ncbi:pyridoxamine 5'-phosphate oxidase family protein [Desulfovibrio sp. OttesenSCG-928-G15]|nr:pyridoxamine 5'-phosphate oxidase family protein [Desulfovibrio sp. OttesenSCG-928-G15]
MRRKDCALAPQVINEVLDTSEYGILALNDPSGWPYAVPLSFVHMDGAIYVHCATSGRKNTLITQCDKVCFTTVCDTKPVYLTDFSTYYKSIMVFGKVREVTQEQEKNRALHALAKKYLPDHMDKADDGIAKYATRTKVYKISMDVVSGKGKVEK